MPLSLTIALPSLEQTMALGKRLGRAARAGDVVTLNGGLGSGKTTLTQAIGLGLEVDSACYITSPTFSLLHEYPGRLPLYHMDLYRLGGEEDVASLGFEEYLYGEGLTVIEWPDRLGGLLPDDFLDIELSWVSETARAAVLTGHGEAWQQRLPGLAQGDIFQEPPPGPE